MNRIIVVIFANIALMFSSLVFAECGYGTIDSVRFDDARGEFRVAFISQPTSVNGCKVQNRTIIVKQNYNDVIIDSKIILSAALTAVTTGKTVWVKYDDSGNANGANYLTAFNIYKE